MTPRIVPFPTPERPIAPGLDPAFLRMRSDVRRRIWRRDVKRKLARGAVLVVAVLVVGALWSRFRKGR